MITSQQTFISLPELLFDNFTELLTNEEGIPLRVFNTLTNDYSKEEIRRIVADTELRSISCLTNERAVGLLVLRALVMKEAKKAPAMLVVPSEIQAKEVLSFIDKQLSSARIANLFSQIKIKTNYTIYGEPDFIVCSYHKLLQMLAKKSTVNVSAIVFLAPLSRTKYYTESIHLDQILFLLNSKTSYTFIHGEELRLQKKNLESLFAGPAIVYHAEKLFRYDLVEEFRLNIFENKALVSAALKKHSSSSSIGESYLLKLILTLTFRRRRNLKQLQEAIKQSISYRLWQASEQTIKKTPGRTTYSCEYQLWLILRYLTNNCMIKLIAIKPNGCYYVTNEGQQFFYRFCFSDGLTVSLFSVLHTLSKKIEKGLLSQKDMEELMNDFTNLDIIWDVFYLDETDTANYEIQKALNNSYSFRAAQEIFEGLDEDFRLLTDDAKRSLNAQKTIMKEQKAQGSSVHIRKPVERTKEEEEEDEVVEELVDYKITKIYSKEFLEDYVQKFVSRENITAQQIAARTGVGVIQVKKVLERLVRKGVCIKITTKGVFREEAIYGTEENISAEPHLNEKCGTCVSYDSKTRLCITNRHLAEFAYSTLTQEQITRAFNPISSNTRACNNYEDAQKSKEFTLEYSEFSFCTRKTKKALHTEKQNTKNDFSHHCLFCTNEIKAFGNQEEAFFPSRKIICSNCNSRYVLVDESRKIRCLSDTKNVIRSIIFRQLAYIPEILQQKDERIPITIRDEDEVALHINDFIELSKNHNKVTDSILSLNGHRFPLQEIERIYFQGEKHTELEEELRKLGTTRIYRRKSKVEQKEENNITDSNHVRIKLDESTKKNCQRVVKLFREKGLLVNSLLVQKIYSIINLILTFNTKNTSMKNIQKPTFNKELGESLKILMRAKNEVTNPEAARILEGQAFNQAFKILKQVARRAGIRSWGRVASRLVSWLVFAVFTRTCAYSPLDSMLNHLFKIVLGELKEIHKKTGIDVDFGAGLLHFRESKSDIDKKGLFLDLVDFTRLIVIFVLAEAISKGEITGKDCRLFLGRGAIPLYDIQITSLQKFDELAERVLNYKIVYNGCEKPLKIVYEEFLESFRDLLINLANNIDILEKLPDEELLKRINEEMKNVNYQPIYFQQKEFEKILAVIDLCSEEWKFLYEGFEEKYLVRKQVRVDFRRRVMKKLFEKEKLIIDLAHSTSQEKYLVSLTKYQKRERRWLFYILLVLAAKTKKSKKRSFCSINDFQKILGLKYKRTRLLLEKLVAKGMLHQLKGKFNKYYFHLNYNNDSARTVMELLDIKIYKNNNFYRTKSSTRKKTDYKKVIPIAKQYITDFFDKHSFLLIDQRSIPLENILRGILEQLIVKEREI
ncbi:MAG: hypothetical protein JJE41_13655 [Candidatus Heimdallarchaeota archaeon]|nr:hypothetical protein [Candidatus Heimdallarchaeota archaeon]